MMGRNNTRKLERLHQMHTHTKRLMQLIVDDSVCEVEPAINNIMGNRAYEILKELDEYVAIKISDLTTSSS